MAKIRVRARTVDMLGRQQIAGLPTAISELFKNAHDAYAKRVEVDFYRSDGLFVLRDDGLGMTMDDFTDRWLTLGTESKLKHSRALPPPAVDAGQPRRAILGEKGIGRLAIAAIGPQVLVLSRAKREGKPQPGVAAFVNWGLFALPGVDLDEIEIPLIAFRAGSLPQRSEIEEMVKSVANNAKSFLSRVPHEQIDQILVELGQFNVDPLEVASFLVKGPSLKDAGHGTHFLIMPAEETLRSDLESRGADQTVASPLTKVLIGFTNTMTPGHAPPAITAVFRDHSVDGVVTEHIGGAQFFSPEEFQSADHHFQGEFDEFGAFSGTVKVYKSPPTTYQTPWKSSIGNHTKCGPFRINIAYIQGKASESILPPEEHARMLQKLNRIGGLYIYRDGVRILPYGNSDYDFLNIEQRRTKSAYYYFFSYRRMFGVIEISRDANEDLVEKAGREGFRENIAYRQFREILENFFMQLAADFFRDDAVHGAMFAGGKADLEREDQVRRKQAAYVATRRASFQQQLEAVFSRMHDGEPTRRVAELLEESAANLLALRRVRDESERARRVSEVMENTRTRFDELRNEIRVVRPRGVSFSKALKRDWNAYQSEAARQEAEVIAPAVERFDESITRFCSETGTEVDRRRHFDEAVYNALSRKRHELTSEVGKVREETEAAMQRILTTVRTINDDFHRKSQEALVEISRTPVAQMSEVQIRRSIVWFDESLNALSQEHVAKLQLMRADVARMADENLPNASEVAEILEGDLEELRERELAGLELAQVGMALGIIHHEFASSINSIRAGLSKLKRWADKNAQLAEVHDGLRTAFDHLDGYLTLFTPLNRRLYRKQVVIVGAEIYTFLTDLFGPRLTRHHVSLQATLRFMGSKIKGFPSSFYPTFVNLVDNSIFWMSERQSHERKIVLDADGDTFIVSDTGPGIGPRDADTVFELGFSRKPAGRGMGLYISKETLKRVGYDLTLDPYVRGSGTTFRISRIREGAENDDE